MANIIAIVWDFDKTLVDGYMQDPIFRKYNIVANEFWEEVNKLPERYKKEQNIEINPDTIYLNHFLNYVEEGRFKGLNNGMLQELGKELKFYKGIPKIFKDLKILIENNSIYNEYDIKIEHYIVSTGLKKMIEGSSVAEHVKGIWGCEFIDGKNKDGETVIKEIGYTIDNTSKTRALFEINKGVNIRPEITVNSTIPEENRRVHFINMIYVADGPSDIPAFSVMNKNNGATFAIYPKGNMKALKQVESMREDHRIDMYAEADYSEGTTAYMWLSNKITEFAERIRQEERAKIQKFAERSIPVHLTDDNK